MKMDNFVCVTFILGSLKSYLQLSLIVWLLFDDYLSCLHETTLPHAPTKDAVFLLWTNSFILYFSHYIFITYNVRGTFYRTFNWQVAATLVADPNKEMNRLAGNIDAEPRKCHGGEKEGLICVPNLIIFCSQFNHLCAQRTQYRPLI